MVAGDSVARYGSKVRATRATGCAMLCYVTPKEHLSAFRAARHDAIETLLQAVVLSLAARFGHNRQMCFSSRVEQMHQSFQRGGEGEFVRIFRVAVALLLVLMLVNGGKLKRERQAFHRGSTRP